MSSLLPRLVMVHSEGTLPVPGVIGLGWIAMDYDLILISSLFLVMSSLANGNGIIKVLSVRHLGQVGQISNLESLTKMGGICDSSLAGILLMLPCIKICILAYAGAPMTTYLVFSVTAFFGLIIEHHVMVPSKMLHQSLLVLETI